VTRRRLEPQQRREQLLDIGAALFAEKPYEDVFMEDIAAPEFFKVDEASGC
jgi:AcrR family transcriptional regulator